MLPFSGIARHSEVALDSRSESTGVRGTARWEGGLGKGGNPVRVEVNSNALTPEGGSAGRR
jgi:hypothetical protein